MRLPSGMDEELELLDHLASPELEERMKHEDRQRELLSNGGRRATSPATRPSTLSTAEVSSAASPELPPPPKWGSSLSPRRREAKPPASGGNNSEPGMAYYTPEEFKRAFPNKKEGQ